MQNSADELNNPPKLVRIGADYNGLVMRQRAEKVATVGLKGHRR